MICKHLAHVFIYCRLKGPGEGLIFCKVLSKLFKLFVVLFVE